VFGRSGGEEDTRNKRLLTPKGNQHDKKKKCEIIKKGKERRVVIIKKIIN